jgi:FkbM family methyltransferase
MLTDRLKQWIKGTALERPARYVHAALRGEPEVTESDQSARVAADLNRRYDDQSTRVMERILHAEANCIDVGCHTGQILDEMLRFAPHGRHYGFEPLPHLNAALKAKYAERRNVTILDVALADAPGESVFQHVVTNPAYSGLRRRSYDRPAEEIVEIRVRLARLDDVLPADLPVRLIKIDVEGAELQVMRGAQALLRRWRPVVIFEHGMGAADHYGTRPEAVFDLLADCGLRVSLMQDWLASDGSSLSRPQFAAQFDQRENFYFMAHP